MDKLPRVSVLTPLTHDRLKFVDLMVGNILNQDYPHELIEWVVVGDNLNETEDVFENIFKKIEKIKCKYVPCYVMNDIGKKRNFCVKNASNKILANMDSDDIYQKTFLSYSVNELKTRQKGIVGCKDLIILFPKNKKWYISRVHPYMRVHLFLQKNTGNQLNTEKVLNVQKVMICLSTEIHVTI